ncbi:MAG: hypothetical protein RBT80_00095 [Candidatus Vecturithrix sp.]|jgi:hypothetical protein|nr:hypothetical protein [Candidatus Vecturithrix sp.]
MTEQEKCRKDQQQRYQDVVQKIEELLEEYLLCDPPYQYDADSEMINFIVFLRKKSCAEKTLEKR